MAQKRLSMRKLREVFRLKHERGLSNRKIGRSLKISHTTVAEYLGRAAQTGIGWPLSEEWDEERWKRRSSLPRHTRRWPAPSRIGAACTGSWPDTRV